MNERRLPLMRACELVGASLVPIAALHSGMYQLHPRIGWIDPGLYIYNFFSLPKNMALFGSTPVGADYHFSRLPYVLPGYALYRVLDPVRAQAALVTAFYGLGVVALLCLARTLIKSVPGRLALVWVVALNPLWIAAFVDGYVDGPAMTFVFFAFAALASPQPRLLGVPRPFWAGVSVALAVSTQMFAGAIAGFVMLVVSVRRRAAWRDTVVFLAWGAAGGIGTIVGLGALGVPFGVPFLYLLSSADWLRRVSNGVLDDYIVAPARWLPAATRVALWPLMAALLARVAIRRSRARERAASALLDATSLWAMLYVAADFATHHFFAQFRFYAGYVFVPLVPSLAALVDDVTDERATLPDAAVAPAAALAMGVALPFGMARTWAIDGAATPIGSGVWFAIAALAAAGFAATRARGRQLAFVGIASSLTLAGSANLDTAAVFAARFNADHRAASMAVAEVHKAVDRMGLSDRRILTWFNRDAYTDANGRAGVYEMDFAGRTYRYNLLDTVAASFGWSQTTLGFEMPAVDGQGAPHRFLRDGVPTAVVVLCKGLDECQAGEQALARHGAAVSELVSRRVEPPGLPAFSFAILDVRPEAR